VYELEIIVVWHACNNTTPIERDRFMNSVGFISWMKDNHDRLLIEWMTQNDALDKKILPTRWRGWNA
jgi:hypothetical protein